MDDRILTSERAQFAAIGIAVTLLAIMGVAFAASSLEPWALLALAAPIGVIITAISRLRRIRATGRAD